MMVCVPGVNLQHLCADLVRGGLSRKHFSQQDLARTVGVSEKHLSEMLSGKAAGSMELWQRLLDALDGAQWRLSSVNPQGVGQRPEP
jgi:transcriptional regulator with XRE-family HTH domain